MFKENKKIFIYLWIACLVGTWALVPYIHFLNVIPGENSIWKLLGVFTLQAGLIYGVVLYLSYRLIPKTDLKPFVRQNDVVSTGLLSGIAVGLFIFALDQTIFRQSVLAVAETPPRWAGALASLYGGINEEVLLRLFFFSLIYFLLGKLLSKRNSVLWATNIFCALLFGMAHLPAAMSLAPLTGLEVSRILLGNGVPGLVFGYLFWSRGFFTAAFAHSCADLTIHVLLK